MSCRCSQARRWGSRIFVTLGLVTPVVCWVLPAVIASRARGDLAAYGFDHAKLDVASVGIEHLEFSDVHLGEGLDLGSVSLDGGISLLWRGSPSQITVRDAQVSSRGLAALTRSGDAGGQPQLEKLLLENCTIAMGDVRVIVSGTITPSSIDLVAHSPQWRIGDVTVRDLVATARTTAQGIRACAAARVSGSTLEVCSLVPGSLAALRDVHALDVAMRLRSSAWTATGQGHLAWPERDVRAITWTARDFQFGDIHIEQPSGTIDLAGPGVHTIAWTGISGAPVALGAGQAVLNGEAGGVRIAQAQLHALGGSLEIEPFATDLERPLDIAIHARGLDLARMLATFGEGHVEGSGLLDGEVALHVDASGASLSRAEVHARGRGAIRIGDPAWRSRFARGGDELGLQSRIASALTDYEYSDLSAVLGPRGDPSELRVTTHGRGRRVAQDVDLVVNVHGVRDAVPQLVAR